VGDDVTVPLELELLDLRAQIAVGKSRVGPVHGLERVTEHDLPPGVHGVGVGVVLGLGKVLRGVLVVLAPQDVDGGLLIEVAGAIDVRRVVGQFAAEVEEGRALLGDDAVERVVKDPCDHCAHDVLLVEFPVVSDARRSRAAYYARCLPRPSSISAVPPLRSSGASGPS
jgi:hypothetical protein